MDQQWTNNGWMSRGVCLILFTGTVPHHVLVGTRHWHNVDLMLGHRIYTTVTYHHINIGSMPVVHREICNPDPSIPHHDLLTFWHLDKSSFRSIHQEGCHPSTKMAAARSALLVLEEQSSKIKHVKWRVIIFVFMQFKNPTFECFQVYKSSSSTGSLYPNRTLGVL